MAAWFWPLCREDIFLGRFFYNKNLFLIKLMASADIAEKLLHSACRNSKFNKYILKCLTFLKGSTNTIWAFLIVYTGPGTTYEVDFWAASFLTEIQTLLARKSRLSMLSQKFLTKCCEMKTPWNIIILCKTLL